VDFFFETDFFRQHLLFYCLKAFPALTRVKCGLSSTVYGLAIYGSSAIGHLFLTLAKFHLFFKYSQLVDFLGVDRLTKTGRFRLVYVLKNPIFGTYFYVHILVKNSFDTAIHFYQGLVWAERETWDMLGVIFKDHPDLRRLLNDYGFRGYPLRKDFPLTGFKELFYSEYLRLIRWKRVSLMQEFRNMIQGGNPWVV